MRTGIPRACLAPLSCLAVLLLSAQAQAYPYFIGLRHGTCGECHYSPTGGGLINDWGRATRGVSIGGQDDWPLHSDARGYAAEGQAELQADAGADARLLALIPTSAQLGSPALIIPMLIELEGVAAFGPWQAYAGVTPRPGTPGRPYLLFSREHWLLFHATPELTLRLGRLVLPFGIRTPDHTEYVRQDFGFDKWDQSYALEADLSNAVGLVSAAIFAGDLTGVPAPRQERGGALRTSFDLADDRGWVGASLLAARSEASDRLSGSLFVGLRPLERGYLLAELAGQQQAGVHSASTLTTGAAFLRLGWFWNDAVDLFAELGYRRIADHPELSRERATAGSNWQLCSWLELVPSVQFEHASGDGSELLLLGQLHLMH